MPILLGEGSRGVAVDEGCARCLLECPATAGPRDERDAGEC